MPLINTPEDAAKAVAACRYPPVGMRSSGPVRAVHYGGADYVAKHITPRRLHRGIFWKLHFILHFKRLKVRLLGYFCEW